MAAALVGQSTVKQAGSMVLARERDGRSRRQAALTKEAGCTNGVSLRQSLHLVVYAEHSQRVL